MKHKNKEITMQRAGILPAFCHDGPCTARLAVGYGDPGRGRGPDDVDSGTMHFGQNSHVEYPPASITKLLTALIVLEHAELSDTVT